MPLVEIKYYAELRSQGEMTVSQRMAVLKLHRKKLVVRIQELSHNLTAQGNGAPQNGGVRRIPGRLEWIVCRTRSIQRTRTRSQQLNTGNEA